MTDIAHRPCIAWDFDGTLGDTLPAIVETARTVLLGFGMRPDELGDLSRLVGPPFPQAFSQVYGLSEADAAEVTRRYREIYNTLGAEAWPPFPGVPELLADLRKDGRTLVVASSKRTPLLRRCVSDGGMADDFACIYGKNTDAAVSKADTVLAAVREAGFTPDDAVMVGDRHFDIEAAHEAGMPGIGVYFGDTAPAGELEAAGADAVVHSVGELRAFFLA
ncbi:MAG: HAD hydrolase-like protein [Olegusella sp.]|nr:HAD hydrolase-like protein [Olegusella sp.]